MTVRSQRDATYRSRKQMIMLTAGPPAALVLMSVALGFVLGWCIR